MQPNDQKDTIVSVLSADKDLLAPGRGQYDRLASRRERDREQLERLLHATAIAFSKSAAPSVRDVVTVAGVSRNTFYQHFSNVEEALLASAAHAGAALDRALSLRLAEERTPVARLRAVVRGSWEWLESEVHWNHIVRFTRSTSNGQSSSALRLSFHRALCSCLESSWLDMRQQGNINEPRLIAAVVGLEELTRRYPRRDLNDKLEEEIVQVLVRLFH